jgi:UDP-2,3-diacylglucosamine pyrophosphatase LpxH
LNGKAARGLAKWLKKRAKLLTRNSDAVLQGAISYAKEKRVQAIFCGHTHMPMLQKMDGIVYGNDGTWQSDDPHFIGIEGRRIELCKYVFGAPEVISIEWMG